MSRLTLYPEVKYTYTLLFSVKSQHLRILLKMPTQSREKTERRRKPEEGCRARMRALRGKS